MSAAVHWSLDQAAWRLRDPAVIDDLLDAALLVVDARGGPAPGEALLLRVPCPTLVLDPAGQAPAFDLVLREGDEDTALLDPQGSARAAAEVLAERAAAALAASRVLVAVLRASGSLGVPAALALESAAYSLLLTGPDFRTWLASRRVPAADASTDPAVRAQRRGEVLEVALHRPAVHNAYDVRVRDGLVEALSLAVCDDTVARVVLRGDGPSFCSGGDLRGFGVTSDQVWAHTIRTARSPAALLHDLANRLEVRVHGACIGAGLELAAFAGRVVADPATTFLLPELPMGTIPGAGGTVSLPRRIGRQRTTLLTLGGFWLDARQALRWGLVDALEPVDG